MFLLLKYKYYVSSDCIWLQSTNKTKPSAQVTKASMNKNKLNKPKQKHTASSASPGKVIFCPFCMPFSTMTSSTFFSWTTFSPLHWGQRSIKIKMDFVKDHLTALRKDGFSNHWLVKHFYCSMSNFICLCFYLQSLLSRADTKVKQLRQSIDRLKAESEKLEVTFLLFSWMMMWNEWLVLFIHQYL